MTRKKSYILFAWMLVLVLIGGIGVRGKALSTNGNAALQNAKPIQNLSLIQNLHAGQSILAQNPSAYSGYTPITDNEEKIKLQVPVEWNDIETGVWLSKGKSVGVFVAASGDLANFYSSRSQPGVFIGVSSSLAHTYDKDGLLGREKQELSKKCLYQGRFTYQTNFYQGNYDQFTNCAEGVPNLLVFTAASADKKSLILIRMNVVSEADLAAADKIINSFQVLGDPEKDDHHEN